MTSTIRKVIHIDMDAFFASVEQRDFAQYRGKPIIVGGLPNTRGVVATCSYEARKFGVHSGLSSAIAARRCPQAIFVKPRFSVYRQISEDVFAIFRRYTDLVETMSVDEAYLDVTDSDAFQGSATRLAEQLRREIYQKVRLTASAGISYNKLLAKLATSVNKPNGQFTVTPAEAQKWLRTVAIGALPGVGSVTRGRFHLLGVNLVSDMLDWSAEQLRAEFGKMGMRIYQMARGIDNSAVAAPRTRKSFGSERTYQQDVTDEAEMRERLGELAEVTFGILKKYARKAQTLTIKVRYPDMKTVTRAHTAEAPFGDIAEVKALIGPLLAKTEATARGVRLLGVSFSSINRPKKPSAKRKTTPPAMDLLF